MSEYIVERYDLMNKMVANAERALRQVLDLHKSEKVLIVTDKATRDVASAWCKAATKLGAEVVTWVIPEQARPLASVPEDLAACIPGTGAIITAFSIRRGETPFRLELVGMVAGKVRRIAHCPGIDATMMTTGGMSADFPAMANAARELMRRLSGAVKARITTPAGTELTMDIRGRTFVTDTAIADGGACNLPCGEIWCAPVENGADGILVCDGCAGDLGLVPSPVKLVINNGRVSSVLCEDEAFRQDVEAMLEFDSGASRIGELGIGLNPEARLAGNLLEDEKAAGTAHIAFGNNRGCPGGVNRSKTHQDFLFHNPTIAISFEDGREDTVMVSGRISRQRQAGRRPATGTWSDILVVTDITPASEEAVMTADRLARLFGSRLICAHVLDAHGWFSGGLTNQGQTHRPEIQGMLATEALRALSAMVSHLTGRTPEDFEVRVLTGEGSLELDELVSGEGIDLIVTGLGLSGQGARRHAAATLKGIIENADCDVLVVKS